MRRLFAGGVSVTVALAFGIVAFAQAPAQTPQPQTPTTTSAPQSPDKQSPGMESITISGCVQSEADYRRAKNLGSGGAAGTGAGVGNEYVLVNASTSSGSTASTGATPGAGAATGTSGGSSAATAYELTGPNESQAGQYVGKRVEITGKLKPAETTAGGTTGGATAGTPPRGVDVTSPDLKLREIEVTSVRESTGTCPSAEK
jgi:hypothetical protein